MRIGVALGGLAGLGLAAWLLASYGVDEILALLARAGGGMALMAASHIVQIAFSAAAWRAVAGVTAPQPDLAEYMALRWIREGVNNLLPVAQVGGEVVAARLLRRRGVPLASAIAGSVGGLTVEIVTQIAFTQHWCPIRTVDVERQPEAVSADALRRWHAGRCHPVQHGAGNLGLALLGRWGPGTKAAADDGFAAERRRLRVRSAAVTDRLLPSHAPLVPDHVDVLVALAGCRARGRARHGR